MTRRTYRNRCLAYLPDSDLAQLERGLVPVSFEVGDVLYEQDDSLDRIIFVETGLLACLTHMADGSTSESLTIGPEGALGITCGMGVAPVPRRVVGSVEGEAFALPASELRTLVAERPAIREMTLRASAATMSKLMQSVACNARHNLEQRFARRILACSDASPAKRFALTQDGLAETLGVRRTSVTAAAKTLREEGLIGYRHGRIWIDDRPGLEARACECRKAIMSDLEALLPRSKDRDA